MLELQQQDKTNAVSMFVLNKWFIATKALRHKGAERRATRDAIHYVPLPLCAYLAHINFGFVLHKNYYKAA